jgi:hypothetical protein
MQCDTGMYNAENKLVILLHLRSLGFTSGSLLISRYYSGKAWCYTVN